MSDSEGPIIPMLPLAAKTLRLQPGEITPAIEDSPYVVHFTMAALDSLNPADKTQKPSTLRLIRINEQSSEEEDDEESEDDDEDTEPVTLLTLSPSSQYQQPLDLYVSPTEGICFEVIGSYPIHLTGNIIDHPITEELLALDEDEDEEDSEEDSEEENSQGEDDSDEESGEEAEIMELDSEDDSDELDEVEEAGPERIQEVKEAKETKQQAAPKSKKREQEPEAEAESEPKKKVKFSASLEKGPEATESKYQTKKLEGGVVIEDRKTGEGPSAKKGSKVSMRYVGKLANGKVFDKNTGGKPFTFALGRGEVIKGWDVGIVGIKAGGERRIVIPAPMAYGKQSLPGIPKNSELRFDVKCISIK